MNTMAMPFSLLKRPVGTGGFLNPEEVSNEFGVKKGMSIADFGCGAGYFTIILAEKVGKEGRIYALDVQEGALDSVRAKARGSDMGNVQTIRTNLEILGSSGLPNNSQDMVMLHNILFQSDKKTEVIREAHRVLKVEGKAVIIEWQKGADGFGPPDDLRTDSKDMRKFGEELGLVFIRDFKAGDFHYGIIMEKK